MGNSPQCFDDTEKTKISSRQWEHEKQEENKKSVEGGINISKKEGECKLL